MSQLDPVQLALAIRRGAFKLEHVPDAARGTVRAVLHSLTDAQCGVILHAQEKKTKQLGRATVRTRRALS